MYICLLPAVLVGKPDKPHGPVVHAGSMGATAYLLHTLASMLLVTCVLSLLSTAKHHLQLDVETRSLHDANTYPPPARLQLGGTAGSVVHGPHLNAEQRGIMERLLEEFRDMHDRILSKDCLASSHTYASAMREASAARVSINGIYSYIAHAQYWGMDEARRRVAEANFAAVVLRDGAHAWLHCRGGRKMNHSADSWVRGHLRAFVCHCGTSLGLVVLLSAKQPPQAA